MSYKRVLAFISDLHVFSRYALNPPRFLNAEDQTIINGPGQQKIFDFWIRFCKICDKNDVDTVVTVGDLMHGQNPIERGTLLTSANMDEQEDACVEILRMIVQPESHPACQRTLYGVSGSGYHVSSRGHSTEKDVIERLNGHWLGPITNMTFSKPSVYLPLDELPSYVPSKKVFNIAHGESAAFIYREMLLGREGMFLRESQAMGKIPKIHAFVRGHWHSHIYIHEKDLHMCQLPGWIAYEPSKPYLKSYGKMSQMDIGGVIVFIDQEDRLRFWHFLLDEPVHICDFVREG